MRIPRKLKKKYKKIWKVRLRYNPIIVKSTIEKDNNTNVWGCITKRYKNESI